MPRYQLLIYLFFSFCLTGQSVIQDAEYFWGTNDPGAGNGVQLSAVDSNFNEVLERLIKSDVNGPSSSGLNLFNIRIKDGNGNWGPLYRRVIRKSNLRQLNITSGEYFWGSSDPGEGSAIAMFAFDGDYDEAFERIFKDSTSYPSTAGAYLFNIRVRDDQNEWGPLYRRTIFVYDSTSFSRDLKINSAEYFWGSSDPGTGNGTVMLAFDGNYDEALEQILKSNAGGPSNAGLNLFNIRVKDSEGNWGPLYRRAIFKSGTARDIKITSGEYFWGTSDPGEGSATAMFAFDGDYDEAFERIFKDSTSYPSTSGAYLFNVRIRDDQNEWGPLYRRTIFVYDSTSFSRDLKITSAEYFWGSSDPGPGNGTVLLAFDGNYDEALEQILKSNAGGPSNAGLNLFNIRVKDSEENWGPLYQRAIFTADSSALTRNLKLTFAEFFWGMSDPGQGNGIQILTSDGSFDEAIEQLYASNAFSPGPGIQLFNIRVKDDNYEWGPLYKRAIDVQIPENDLEIVNLSGSDTICRGDTIVLQALGGINMMWYSDTLSDYVSDTLTLIPDSSFQLMLTGFNPNEGNDTAYINITVGQHVAVNINSGVDSLNLCELDSVLLDAGLGYDIYGWSPGQFTTGETCLPFTFSGGINSQSIYAQESGTYYVHVTDSLNCSSTDSIVVSILNPSIIGPTSIFEGDTINLVASIDGVGFLLQEYDTVYVNPSQSIQSILDTVSSGTVLLLESGVYLENIIWPQTDHVILSSVDGPEQTEIDGSSANESVIYIGNGQIGAIVDGLKITGGFGSQATFNSNRFGGGVLIDEDVRAVVQNCLIVENAINNPNIYGGGIFISYSSEVYCINNTISNNWGAGIWWRSGEQSFCDFNDPFGGEVTGKDGAMINNIITYNGYGLYNQSGGEINSYSIRFNNSYGNSINWYNGASSYSEEGFNGNISQDPLFDTPLLNYQLLPNSPSIGTGEYGVDMGYQGSSELNNLVYSPESIDYNWSTGDFTQNSIIAPSENSTIYLDVVSGMNTCSDSITVKVFPHIKDTLCVNEVYDFNGTLLSDAGVYIDTLIDNIGQDSLVKLTLTFLDLPSVFAGDDISLCIGDSVVLIGSGAESFIWDNGIVQGESFIPPIGQTNYSVEGTDLYGCVNYDTVSLYVNPLPVVSAGLDSSICFGESIALEGSGVGVGAGGGVISSSVTQVFTEGDAPSLYLLNPTTSDNNSTCPLDLSVSIPIGATITGVDVSYNITAQNGMYKSESKTYLECTSIGGLKENSIYSGTGNTSGSESFARYGLNIANNVNGGGIINFRLHHFRIWGGSGCNTTYGIVNNGTFNVTINYTVPDSSLTYNWDNGVINGIDFTPNEGETVYTLTGIDGNLCQNTDEVIITVNSLPDVDAGIDQVICNGDSTSLSASGALTYFWDHGIADGEFFTPEEGFQQYSVTGTDVNGCVNSDIVLITVNALPTVVAGDDQEICENDELVLNASGAASYDWSDGINDGIVFIPDVGANIYSVIGIDSNGCKNTDEISVLVNSLPEVNGGLDQSVCVGSEVILNGTGAVSYEWSDGIENGVPFNPLEGEYQFHVIGTDENGCNNSDEVLVIVNEYVDPVFDQIDPICQGDIFILPENSLNGIPGTWSPNPNFLNTSSYTFTANQGECANSIQMIVEVMSLPVVSAGVDQEVCIGELAVLNGSGATTYQWSDGIENGISFIPPLGVNSYTVTGTDINGCSNSDIMQMVVYDLPSVDAGNDEEICHEEEVTLFASGIGQVSWSNGGINGQIVAPNVGTHLYTAYLTDANQCTNTDQVQITVNPNPVIFAGYNEIICEGESVTLEASGGNGNYDWSDNIINGVPFQPTPGVYQYSVIGYNDYQCSEEDIVQVTVNPTVYGVDVQEACDSFDWIDGNTYTESNYNATYVLTNVNGCDSIVTLNLTMNYQSDTVLYVSSIGDYKLNGEIYSESGTYEQIIQNQFGCDSTIVLNLTIDASGLNDLAQYGVSVYPNPFWSFITVEFTDTYKNLSLAIIDLRGRKVLQKENLKAINQFDLSAFESGVYYLNVYNKESIIGRLKLIRR